jgi:hypothetical protein
MTKKLIAAALLLLAANFMYAQSKAIKFKTDKNKSEKIIITGKLISTFTAKEGDNTEYYVDFDDKNNQVIISLVAYTEKGFLGSDVSFCKYSNFDKMYLKNTQLQELNTVEQLTIDKIYSYTLSSSSKFDTKSCQSFNGEISEDKKEDVVIRFTDKDVANNFMEELKKKVAL